MKMENDSEGDYRNHHAHPIAAIMGRLAASLASRKCCCHARPLLSDLVGELLELLATFPVV